MLSIDCLLKNTEYIEGVRKYMRYAAAEMRESGKSAEFDPLFLHLRKQGIEMDIETAGAIYIDELSGKEGHSPADEVHVSSTKEFDETARNLLTGDRETEESMKEIGNLSPAKNIAQRVVRAFTADGIVDKSTKSTLRQLQDWYADTLRRMSPEEGGSSKGKDTRTWQEVIEQGLDKMKVGERDVDGLVHNLETLHKGVNEELLKLTEDLRAEGKEVEAAQWEQRVKHFEDAIYSIALNHGEAKKAVEGALMDEGYAKTNKNGEVEPDFNKLSGETHSAQQIRERVISAMKKHGMDDVTANRVADNMQREFIDAYTTTLRIQDAKQEGARKSWDKSQVKADAPPVDQIISDNVKRWDNYIKYAGRGGEELILSKKTAGDVLRHALIESGLAFTDATGKQRMDIDKLEQAVDNIPDIKKIVNDYFQDKGYGVDRSTRLTEAISDMYEDMFDRLREHVEGKQSAIEKTWYPKNPGSANPVTIIDKIKNRVSEFEKYKTITGNSFKDLIMRQRDSRELLQEAVKEKFGKESGGKTQLDWRKLGVDRPDESALRGMVKEYLLNNGMGLPADKILDAISPLYKDFVSDIDAHAKSMLEAREKAMERQAPERQTAIQNIAELGSLGIFDKAHKKLLENIIGVKDVDAQDLQSIKNISEAFKEAQAEVGDKHGGFLEETMSREINNIIERNRYSKSKALKVAKAVHTWFSLGNFTLISGPFNLIQNLTSGKESVVTAAAEAFKQTGMNFSDKKLWWDTLKDVGMGGASGDAGMKFGNTNFLDKFNTLDFKKEPAKALATASILLYRTALNGIDAANKAVIRNKAFITNIHESLIRNGWAKQEATDFIYDMLYGKNKADVVVKAREVVDKYAGQMGVGESEASRSRAAERLADDMVKANIELSTQLGYNMGTKQPIDASTVEAAFEAAKHGAGVALGHEANNPFSELIQAGKNKLNQKYEESMSRGDYGKAAFQSMVNTVFMDGIFRLASGGANWGVLGLEATGIRGIPAAFHLSSDNRKAWDFKEPKDLQRLMQERTLHTKQVSRALAGVSKAIVVLAAAAGYGSLINKEDEEEGVMEAAARGIKEKAWASKVFKRTAGPLALMGYLYETSKGKEDGSALAASIDFMIETTNSNPAFTAGGKAVRARNQSNKGETGKGWGTLGQIAGDVLPPVPLYKPYKQLIELGEDILGGNPREFDKTKQPQNLQEGLLYGGPVQDMLGTIPAKYLETLGFDNWGVQPTREERKKRKLSLY